MARVNIIGAPGSGTSTVGRVLSETTGWSVFDADDFFWRQTKIPYTEKNASQERQNFLESMISKHENWIICGTMDTWSSPIEPFLDLVVHLVVPTEVRVSRVKEREKDKFGNRILPGGDMHEVHQNFLQWAKNYYSDSDRGRIRHERYLKLLKRLKCPVLRINGELDVQEIVLSIKEACE